jgi:hypothetical protein
MTAPSSPNCRRGPFLGRSGQLSRWHGRDAERFTEFQLPEDLRADVDHARTMRERAEREALESAALARASAKRLAADGLSVRDIGQILGISFQRASQLLTS